MGKRCCWPWEARQSGKEARQYSFNSTIGSKNIYILIFVLAPQRRDDGWKMKSSQVPPTKKKNKKNKGLTLTLIRRDNTYYDMIYGEGGLLGGVGSGKEARRGT